MVITVSRTGISAYPASFCRVKIGRPGLLLYSNLHGARLHCITHTNTAHDTHCNQFMTNQGAMTAWLHHLRNTANAAARYRSIATHDGPTPCREPPDTNQAQHTCMCAADRTASKWPPCTHAIRTPCCNIAQNQLPAVEFHAKVIMLLQDNTRECGTKNKNKYTTSQP